ncbi:MAG: kynureninase [Acetobacteraceae bacterium]
MAERIKPSNRIKPGTRADCLALDQVDPLGHFRQRFHRPPGLIYLDGNSLGMMPKSVPPRIAAVLAEEWAEGLIRSWDDAGWWDLALRVGAKIAPLIGARTDEVVATDSTSINLFKLLAAALALRPERRVILTDPGNFPTDLYIAEGLTRLVPGCVLRSVPPGGIAAALDRSVAVVLLGHVDYRSAELLDMPGITRAAHQAGALALWDLSHSAGAIAVALDAAEVDLAVGCGYKYLNGGPGAPAYLYVRQDLQADIATPIAGWWGHAEPFAFASSYVAAPGIARMLCGTQPILALAALDAALELWREIDFALLEEKRIGLSNLFIGLIEEHCPELVLATPRDPSRRGSHVSFRHPKGRALLEALRDAGVVADFRGPDILRFGITPLTLGYTDLCDAVERLARALPLV